MFFHALTFAMARGSCFNLFEPEGRAFEIGVPLLRWIFVPLAEILI